MTESGAAPPGADAYRIGDIIAGKYRLEQKLGEGGQALVFRAQNLSLDAEVAIKLVHPQAEDRTPAHRLLREARAAAQLGHPGIVRVFDLGETADGAPFLVMELLNGQDLASLLSKQHALTPVFAVRVLLPIADALAAAHARGMVHRDLKPANVFLAEGEGVMQPKLLDFGIVKMRRPTARPESITNDGTVIGSLAYLSPEQARGLTDVDERADIWCFCAMLYECVSGDTPFHAPTYDKMLRSIVNDEPPSLEDHGVDEGELWALIRRGLSKSSDERWQSMRELGRSLASWLKARGVSDDVCGVSLDSRWLYETDAGAPTLESHRDVVAREVRPRVALSAREANDTAAGVSSQRIARGSRSKFRHVLALSVLGSCAGVLGLVLLRAVVRPHDPSNAAVTESSSSHAVALAPEALPQTARSAAVRVTPENPLLPLAPPSPSASVSAAVSGAPSPKSPSRVNVTKSPAGSAAAASAAPSARPKARTDLLNPY